MVFLYELIHHRSFCVEIWKLVSYEKFHAWLGFEPWTSYESRDATATPRKSAETNDSMANLKKSEEWRKSTKKLELYKKIPFHKRKYKRTVKEKEKRRKLKILESIRTVARFIYVHRSHISKQYILETKDSKTFILHQIDEK